MNNNQGENIYNFKFPSQTKNNSLKYSTDFLCKSDAVSKLFSTKYYKFKDKIYKPTGQ